MPLGPEEMGYEGNDTDKGWPDMPHKGNHCSFKKVSRVSSKVFQVLFSAEEWPASKQNQKLILWSWMCHMWTHTKFVSRQRQKTCPCSTCVCISKYLWILLKLRLEWVSFAPSRNLQEQIPCKYLSDLDKCLRSTLAFFH